MLWHSPWGNLTGSARDICLDMSLNIANSILQPHISRDNGSTIESTAMWANVILTTVLAKCMEWPFYRIITLKEDQIYSFVYTSGHCRRWRSRMEVKIMAGSLFVHCKIAYFYSVTAAGSDSSYHYQICDDKEDTLLYIMQNFQLNSLDQT